MKNLDVRVGDTVEYRGAFGSGPLQLAVVLNTGDEKNGKPLVDLNDGHWAYLNQIVRVVQRKPPTTHTAICQEYWDRGLDCQCIPEGVKDAIRKGARPEDVM